MFMQMTREEVWPRLESLVQEANVPVQPALIAQAIDLIVVLVASRAGVAVTEIAQLVGVSPSGYILEQIPPLPNDVATRLRRALVAV